MSEDFREHVITFGTKNKGKKVKELDDVDLSWLCDGASKIWEPTKSYLAKEYVRRFGHMPERRESVEKVIEHKHVRMSLSDNLSVIMSDLRIRLCSDVENKRHVKGISIAFDAIESIIKEAGDLEDIPF
jgi:hypothetical protein